MKKLIERQSGENKIVCDNPNCDFVIKESEYKDVELIEFVNVACPNCGENLLTAKDYIQYLKLIRVVDWINKWFSWITIFIPKNKTSMADVHVHNGINIKERIS